MFYANLVTLLWFVQWDTKKEDAFKKEIARAATDYCSADGAQCQLSSTR